MRNNNIDVLPQSFSTSGIRAIISRLVIETKSCNVGRVKNSFFNKDAITTVPDLEAFAAYVLSGHPFTPAYLLRNPLDLNPRTGEPRTAPSNASTFVSQQIFGVDLDNHATEVLEDGTVKHPEGVDLWLNLSSILDFCAANQLQPFLVYPTMSSTEHCPRFRVLFCHAAPVTDPVTREEIVVGLSNLFVTRFRYADLKCRDVSRFFYGAMATEDIEFYFDDVACNLEHVRAHRLNDDTLNNNMDTYNCNRLQTNPYNNITIGHSTSDDRGDIYKQAARVPFELFSSHSLAEGHFRCEFHDDNNPSAHIFITHSGEYRYKCFGCGISLSGVEYVERTQGVSRIEALVIVMKSRKEPKKSLRKLRQGLARIRKDNRRAYSKLSFHANDGGILLLACMDLAEAGYVIGDEVVFAAPAPLIRQRLKQLSMDKRESSIRKTMKKLSSYGGIVRHVNDEELNERMPKMLAYLKEIKVKKHMRCSVYAIPLSRPFDECLGICLEKEEKRRKSGATGRITQDSARLLGIDVYESLYQRAGIGISRRMAELLKKFRRALKECIQEDAYATKKAVLERSEEGSAVAWRKLREAWPRLLSDYDLVEILVNKQVRRRYHLPDSVPSGSKIIVPREDQGVGHGEDTRFPNPEVHSDKSTQGLQLPEGGRACCMEQVEVANSCKG